MHAFFFGRCQITAQSVCSHIIMTEQIFLNLLKWDIKKEIKFVAEFSVSECVQKHLSPDWYFVKKSCCYDHSKLWINLISSVSFCSNITHITYLQTLLSILRTAQDTVLFVRFCQFLWWTIPNANSWKQPFIESKTKSMHMSRSAGLPGKHRKLRNRTQYTTWN